ncbi:MAG: energy transducer TonB [Vicinamibacterales bacterium]
MAEVARASGLRPTAATARLRDAGLTPPEGRIPFGEAVRLVRILTGRATVTESDRSPVTLPVQRRRRTAAPLVLSGSAHAAGLALLLLAGALGLLAQDTEATVSQPVRLVYTVSLGPGGGGGGGGLEVPAPPPPAQRVSDVRRISNPVPPPRRIPPPPRRPPYRPRPRPTPPPQPSLVEKPPIPPSAELNAVVAPVVPIAGDPVDEAGLLGAPPRPMPSPGPGQGGGVGSGSGTGIGEGRGAGIGPGEGGGTGGGPFRPGSGVTPPVLTREVRPQYTTEARRQAIEGEVDLEIVVTRSGAVGNVRVVRSLGAGLDQRAIDAVRQWRFSPAQRQGTPVDVVVTVSVAFRLR